MFGDTTFEADGGLGTPLRAVLKNTLLTRLRRSVFNERLPRFNDVAKVNNWRDLFVDIAAFSETVTGLQWQPPATTADAETLLASFEALMGQCSPDTLNAWGRAIARLFVSLAPVEERESEEGEGAAEGFLAAEGSPPAPGVSSSATTTSPPENGASPSPIPNSTPKQAATTR